MKSTRHGNEDFAAHGIRKIVWDGPYVETEEGRTIRGAVGRTTNGHYKAAEVSLHQESGPNARVAFSGESWAWSDKHYALKEHAIFAARQGVARTVRDDRQCEEPPRKSVAIKYGGASDNLQRQLPPPSRSR